MHLWKTWLANTGTAQHPSFQEGVSLLRWLGVQHCFL